MTIPTFEQIYGHLPDLRVTVAGRVNLIGEHTDYNDGFVLPTAVPLSTEVELGRREDETCHIWSAQYPATAPIAFEIGVEQRAADWADYARGIVRALTRCGLTRGADIRVTSDIPAGSALASSAAFTVGVGRALREAYGLTLDDLQLAIEARKAETDFIGAPVGIMDPLACSLARPDCALFIDTRSLMCDVVRLPASCGLVVIDSGVRHSHATGDYRTRRAECERAAALLRVGSLRDVDEGEIGRVESLPDPLGRRARHVVAENGRVLAAVQALRAGDLPRLGELFLASHRSMREDFEVSIPEIDALVETARRTAGVYGARLTGGGFGGAIVAVTDASLSRQAGGAIVGAHNRSGRSRARLLVTLP